MPAILQFSRHFLFFPNCWIMTISMKNLKVCLPSTVGRFKAFNLLTQEDINIHIHTDSHTHTKKKKHLAGMLQWKSIHNKEWKPKSKKSWLQLKENNGNLEDISRQLICWCQWEIKCPTFYDKKGTPMLLSSGNCVCSRIPTNIMRLYFL